MKPNMISYSSTEELTGWKPSLHAKAHDPVMSILEEVNLRLHTVLSKVKQILQ